MPIGGGFDMTAELNFMPQEARKAESVGKYLLAGLVQAIADGRILLPLMLLGLFVGVWLGLSPQNIKNITMLQLGHPASQVEPQKIEGKCLDKALVEGVRTALPIAQNKSSCVAAIDTLPFASTQYVPYVNQMDSDSQFLGQASSRSAYLVAIANPEGTRLKTIVNR